MIQFKSFDKTPTEKYIGIATVCVNEKLILRYKVFPGKNGMGFFITPPSLKLNEKYLSAFEFDSLITKNEIEACIRSNMNKVQVQSVPSTPQPTYTHPVPPKYPPQQVPDYTNLF